MNDQTQTEQPEFPLVDLAGKSYSVPPIPFRFASKIVPKLIARPNLTTEQGMIDVATVIFTGLKASHPELDYESFLDEHYTFEELLAALAIVSKQAGLKENTPGEARGAMNPR